ncbi:arf-GAP domain and FG repeat-containing protein 1-like [Nycticebus coucang]|uniref:arf-GAP domain and FG repeat-containing protein 1-like n=1 Tax=Nycticebus coucang TaxID=9470 RepID=UPI00234C0BDC|nr:arf-GAP domain and FG repeat-containing protein 1-like [Nycticebus coucang]
MIKKIQSCAFHKSICCCCWSFCGIFYKSISDQCQRSNSGDLCTASMSMPTGFSTPTPYSLPTSFSGSFQQPAFTAQAAFPQQTAFSQQPNGAGFAAFGQTKPMVTPFGQVAAAGVSSNPSMTGTPTGQFPTGSSSTNPFL